MLKLFRPDKKTPLTRLHLIREGGQPAIDVVFIHGLDGDAYKTWGFDSDPSWSTWILEKFPNTRIWSLEYRIRSSWWFGGAMPLYDRAVNVLATVSSELISNTKVIVICHSYGGLVAKEMVNYDTNKHCSWSIVGISQILIRFECCENCALNL